MNRLALAGLLLLAQPALAHDALTRYLGNEGVLVSSGEHKVLMDAFYAESYGEYVLVDEATRRALLQGTPPYDGVDAVLVSHVHGDHFNAAATLEYLKAQPAVRFYGPVQAVSALENLIEPGDGVAQRLHGFANRPGDVPGQVQHGGITVAAVAIPHSGGAAMSEIDNLAFRVTLADRPTVLHLGDATTDPAEFSRQRAFWRQRHLDVAFPPFWFYLEDSGRAVLEQQLRADQVIGIHVPASATGHGAAWRQRLGGDLFSDPGEERVIPRAPVADESTVEPGPGGP